MAPSRRKAASSTGGGAIKRSRPKLSVDLSGSGSGSDRHHQHGGRYEDALDDDITPTLRDENVESDDDDDDGDDNFNNRHVDDDEEADSEEDETVDAKKLRLAKEYLTKMEEEQSESDDDDDESDEDEDGTTRQQKPDVDKVGKRIAKERLRKSGLLQTHIANSVLEGVQSIRADITSKIEMDAASQAWMGGGGLEAGEGYEASAEKYAKAWLDAKGVTYHRGHDLTPTCVALSQDGHTAYSGAKDGSLIMWNVQEGKKISYILPVLKHTNESNNNNAKGNNRNRREIMAIATSDDDRYLAVGGRDNCVRVFDIRTLGKSTSSNASPSPIATFEGHKKAVMALTFRSRTLDLYSGSEDRCIRRYDLNAMTYVETLYGHQSPVIGIHCAHKNRPVSIAKDRTVRVWKVEEDSHLVFRPGGDVGSAECVSAIQDGWFVTGHDDGRLALWREEKKRPVATIIAAHGFHGGDASAVPRSVLCCDAVGLSDVLATGSNDGYLRLWRVSTAEKDAGITALETVPIHGHINSVAMGPGGKFAIAAVGQEPRMGRWDRIPRAKNRFAIIQLAK